jgi:hypothetical protein
MKWKILKLIFTIPIFPIYLIGLLFQNVIIPFGEAYLCHSQNFMDIYADFIEKLIGYK